MANVEKISIALPTDMATLVRKAVETGDYASSSEVIREALREWTARRAARSEAVGNAWRRCGSSRAGDSWGWDATSASRGPTWISRKSGFSSRARSRPTFA